MIKVSKTDTKKRGDFLNKPLLESIIKLHGDTGTSLAEYLGMARSTFSTKVNETNGAEFTQGEISKIKEKYLLTPEQIDTIFFTRKVS